MDIMKRFRAASIIFLTFITVSTTFSFDPVILRPSWGEYTSYDLIHDKVADGMPAKLANVLSSNPSPRWNSLSYNDVDAAIRYPQNNKVYLFSGSKYYRYDVTNNQVDSGYPLRVGVGGWRGVWSSGVDAALVSPDKSKVYFFKGSQYIRWDVAQGRVDTGYPKRIGIDGWQGLWNNGVDAAVTNPVNGKIYFFKNGEYIRYTVGNGVDTGYPRKVGSFGWKGVYPDLSAAIAIDSNRIDFFHKRKNTVAVFNYPLGDRYQDSNDTNIHDYYIALLNGAVSGSQVRLMVGGWDRSEFVTPIKNAIARGVNVKIIANSGNGNGQLDWYEISGNIDNELADLGANTICRWQSSRTEPAALGITNIHHAKFLLFSHTAGSNVYGKYLVVNGSSNWRLRDVQRQNDAIAVADMNAYLYYKGYFDQLYKLCLNQPITLSWVFGNNFEFQNIGFGLFPALNTQPIPQDPVLKVLDQMQCQNGHGLVRVAASSFSGTNRGNAVLNKLKELKSQGCDVRFIGEGYNSDAHAETQRWIYSDLTAVGIPNAKSKTHSKYLVARDYINGNYQYYVITGSLNFSTGIHVDQSGDMIDTTVTIKDDKALYSQYYNHWNWLWNTSFEYNTNLQPKLAQ